MFLFNIRHWRESSALWSFYSDLKDLVDFAKEIRLSCRMRNKNVSRIREYGLESINKHGVGCGGFQTDAKVSIITLVTEVHHLRDWRHLCLFGDTYMIDCMVLFRYFLESIRKHNIYIYLKVALRIKNQKQIELCVVFILICWFFFKLR